jgi:hypothetical protein
MATALCFLAAREDVFTNQRHRNVGRGVIESGGAMRGVIEKAAEDSRTPRRWRDFPSPAISARFWSAAVLCRFVGLNAK